MSHGSNTKKIGRRLFLKGSAGFLLPLPLLPSLLSRQAFGGALPFSPSPRFVSFATYHGGVWGNNFYPGAPTALSPEFEVYPGHLIHSADLNPSLGGGETYLSPVLRAPSSKLSTGLIQKMNVIRGLDIQFYLGHHGGGHLGNYAAVENISVLDGSVPRRPTIDQVMAYSPSFYPSLSGIKSRSLHVQAGGPVSMSWNYSNPGSQNGSIVAQPSIVDPKQLFDDIFVNYQPPTEPGDPEPEIDPRPLLVDRVLESYNRLRHGVFGDANRLSAADGIALDNHMDRLLDLQRRIEDETTPIPPIDPGGTGYGAGPTSACGDINTVTMELADEWDQPWFSLNTQEVINYHQLINDVIVAGFVCGSTRIATIHAASHFSNSTLDWHPDVAHAASYDASKQDILCDSKQLFFENIMLDLAQKLDAIPEANGTTFLDNTLLCWTQEAGVMSHDQDSMPLVTFGSAAGFFNTGKFVDYRNENTFTRDPWGTPLIIPPGEASRHYGLSYNRWLANVLLSMGLPTSEFEYAGEKGYGSLYMNGDHIRTPQMLADFSSPLPIITT